MLSKYDDIAAVPNKVIVTDWASVMIKMGSDCEQVGGHVLCVCHLLNTCIEAVFKEKEATKLKLPHSISYQAIETVRRLAQKTHQSTKCLHALQRACTNVDINFKRIPRPCPTRWNSICFSMEAVDHLREAFINIQENNDCKELNGFIPTRDQFKLIKKLLPILQMIRGYSEVWSSDKQVKIHEIVSDFFEMITQVDELRNSQRDTPIGHEVKR